MTAEKQMAEYRRALAKYEAAIRQAFIEAFRTVALDVDLNRVIALLDAGNVEEAVYALRPDQGKFARLMAAIRDSYEDSGQVAAALPRSIQGRFSFNGFSPAAVAWTQDNGATLIQGIQADTEAMTRAVISDGLERGLSSKVIARSITGKTVGQRRVGGYLGLTTQLAESVMRSRSRLYSGDPVQMAEYLTLKLRDRRYDAKIKRAIKEGRGLTGKELDDVLEAHRSKALGYRGKVIARDQARAAQAAGQFEGIEQVLARDDVEAITKRWQHNLSRDPRERHLAMNGAVIDFREPYDMGDGVFMMHPHDPNAPAEHTINCNCMSIYRVRLKRG